MGFSVATPTQSSTIMAELALAEGLAQEGEADGIMPGQEVGEGEMAKQPGQLGERTGCLSGEAKSFSFIKDPSLSMGSALSQKMTDYLSDINRPQTGKTLDPKGGEHHLSFKESLTKTNEFKTLETHSSHLDGQTENKEPSTAQKTQTTAHEALASGRAPQSAAQLRQATQAKHQHNQAKALENKVHQHLSASKSEENRKKENERGETKNPAKRAEQERADSMTRTVEKSEDKEQERQKKQDEEEGFAGGQNGSSHDDEADEEKPHGKAKINPISAEQVLQYGFQDSILSEIFKMRVSQFDVLILFIEILKLEIKGREQETLARRQEREAQLEHMQKVVENFKAQAKSAMNTGIGAGILGIVAGLLPIVGHMKGDWIIKNFGSFFESIRDMPKDTLFKNLGKMAGTMSEMQKGMGQMHQVHSEAGRTYDQHMSDLHRTDWEERTRSIDEIKDSWKGIENFLYQALQMQHETIRQLYNI